MRGLHESNDRNHFHECKPDFCFSVAYDSEEIEAKKTVTHTAAETRAF